MAMTVYFRCCALLLLSVLPLCISNNDKNSYSNLLRKLQHTAQRAFQLHQSNQQAAAYKTLAACDAIFKVAVELRPRDPQAFLTMAEISLNSHSFDKSILLMDKALELLSDKPDARKQVQSQRKFALLGKVSTERDRVYADGKGNISHALTLTNQQIVMHPDSVKYCKL